MLYSKQLMFNLLRGLTPVSKNSSVVIEESLSFTKTHPYISFLAWTFHRRVEKVMQDKINSISDCLEN